MNYIVYVPVKKNVLNLYLKIKKLLNKFLWEYAVLSKDTSAMALKKFWVMALFHFFGANTAFTHTFWF